MNKEIERKFAIKYLPENLKIENAYNIVQNYIYKDYFTTIRTRKITILKDNSTEYIYTVKTKGDINDKDELAGRYEIESNIEEKEYLKITERKIANTINKTRIVVTLENNLKAEIDIYHDYLEGFLTLEVEFPNSKIAKEYEKPDWFGEEIGYSELSNGKLAKMSKEEFESKVTKEFMENNRKIVQQLNKFI